MSNENPENKDTSPNPRISSKQLGQADAADPKTASGNMELRFVNKEGRLGGSTFGSGHDLTVRGSEVHVGLCADSSEPGTGFGFCVSLCLPLPRSHSVSLSLSLRNKINI